MDSSKVKLWAPKVRPERIWQLYQNDSKRTVEDTLVHDVGIALYLRCESVLLVTNGQVKCPTCQTIFTTTWYSGKAATNGCPSCGWTITNERYHASWRHQDLIGANAAPAFRAYVDAYAHATSTPERMLLIDQLIHAFHIGLKGGAPNRSAANNLIEGSHAQVVTMLDRLTYGEDGDAARREAKEFWRAATGDMWERRTGSRDSKPSVKGE